MQNWKLIGQGLTRALPFKVFVGSLGAGLLFVSGVWYERWQNQQVMAAENSGTGYSLNLPGAELDNDTPPTNVDLDLMWGVWNLVKSKYVDRPVNDEDLFQGAMQGMVYGLKDPYSVYFTPEQAEEFNNQLAGSFFGIGAEIGLNDEGAIVVIAPLAGTPADKAGLKSGDQILMVDGVETLGMTVNEVVSHIRGEKGTQVKLLVGRVGEEAPTELTITRDEISIDSVKWTMRDDGLAVISISIFNEDTSELFKKAVTEIKDKKAKGLIIDLRNDPGGYLEAAINLIGYWVDDEVAVKEKTQAGVKEFKADGPNTLKDFPTVILVNGGSASASEILSGALQDYGQATLVGEQTFGKGSVQEYQELPNGGAVKITVARWLTPKDRSIDKLGIEPDYIIPYTKADFDAKRDPQMDEAVRLLSTK